MRTKNLCTQLLVSIVLTMILTGCASLSREQCQRGDWSGIGRIDGRAGAPTSRMDQHLRACTEYGIQINNQQYLDGYARGLQDYCRLDNAFDAGLQGHRYQGVCPPEIDASFKRCNSAAYEVYRLKRELDNLATQIDNTEYQLRNRDLSDDYRRQIRYDLRELDRRHERLRDDLFSSERFLDRLMDEVNISPLH